jgi:hypothetical protein
MIALEGSPRGIDNEREQNNKNDKGIYPPCVFALRVTKALVFAG